MSARLLASFLSFLLRGFYGFKEHSELLLQLWLPGTAWLSVLRGGKGLPSCPGLSGELGDTEQVPPLGALGLTPRCGRAFGGCDYAHGEASLTHAVCQLPAPVRLEPGRGDICHYREHFFCP